MENDLKHRLLNTAYKLMDVRPGERVHVDLIGVDETHVFKHAENALQTQQEKLHQILFSLNLCADSIQTHSLSLCFLPSAWCHREGSAACT